MEIVPLNLLQLASTDAMTLLSHIIGSESTACASLRLFPHLSSFTQFLVPSTFKGTTGSLHHTFYLCFQLRYSTNNLLRQHIPKTSKSLGFAFEQLVVLHGVLDKFTSVDVRISSLLDVTYDVLGYINMKVGR